MDKGVQTWFNNYYGKCLGASAALREINGPEDEAQINKEYNEKFLKPVCYISTGSYTQPEDKAILNKTVGLLGRGPITDWIYLLNYWVDNEFFVYTGDWQEDFDKCVTKTRSEMKVVFATLGRGYKDIALHTVNRTTVDDIPYEVLYYPRDLRAHMNGRMLDDLCAKKPSTLNDIEIAFISAAAARDYITEDDLCKEEIMWPYNKGNDQRFVLMSAITPNRPPADYFELCRNLAPAQVSAFPTLFLAIKDYAKTSPVSDALRNFINIISGSDDLMVDLQTTTAMDDNTVIDYLREHYGIECNDLSKLSVAPGALFQQMVGIDPETLEGSARELLDAVTSNSNATADTLDNIIIKFCEENKLSQQCTIEQLISVLNYDVHPTPPTFVDLVANYVSENKASLNTTLDEVIKGIKHVDRDPIEDIMDFVKTNEFYPQNVKDVLLQSIIDGVMVEWPDEKETVLNALKGLGLPDDLESRIAVAIQTESPVELPEFEPSKEPVERGPEGDKGYEAGSLLLRKTREAICKDSSPNVRMAYTQVLYSFLRLLMCDPKTELSEVTESISSRASKSDGEVKTLLEESLKILRG